MDLKAWFESAFWPNCPKRTHKRETLEALRKLKPDDALRDRLLKAIAQRKLWAESAARRNEFLAEWPDPHRWVKHHRWEDEPPDWWGVEPYRPDPSGTPSRRPPQPLTEEERAELDELNRLQEAIESV